MAKKRRRQSRRSGPAPLSVIVDLLLKSKGVKKLVADHYGPTAKERMKQFRSGDVDELLELFEDNKSELSKVVHTIGGAAPYDDTFSIEIRAFGSLYWVEAIEFEDSDYFTSQQEAFFHALSNFEPYITQLRERDQDTDD